MRKRKDRRLIFILADGIVISISWIFAYLIRYWLNFLFSKTLNPFPSYLYFLPYVLLFSLPIYAVFGFYERRKDVRGFENLQRISKATLISILVIMSLAFLFKELKIGRMVVLFFAVINLPLLYFTRIILYRIFKEPPRNILLVGKGEVIPRIYQKLEDLPGKEYIVGGILTLEKGMEKDTGKAKYLGTLDKLEAILKENKFEEVFFALPDFPREKLLPLVFLCDKYEVEVKIMADLFGVLTERTGLGELDGIPIYSLGIGSISGWSKILKRAMDFTFSLIGIIISLPLWIIIPISIKLDSRGPVFFIQERVGEKGRIFTMLKFRTMRSDVHPFDYAPRSPDDPRITRVGRVIRRMSLDELPQLINVLKGDMSLVGPRPEMPFIVKKYQDWQRKRLEVKPGITGLWQIMGRKDLPLHENLEYDFYYIKNQSLLLDFVILIKTIPQVLLGRGAY
ncbi:sugar transferase [Candidatus Calescamantes bacterium]|nr:sugar transferase [Candidatus Calescamantes bacterium]